MTLFKRYDFSDETPVQFVGVYVLAWRGEWGEPTAMFAEVDDPVYDTAHELLEACKAALFELRHAHSVANGAYSQFDGAGQAILIDMLPEVAESATHKLAAAIAKAEPPQ